MSIWVVMVLLTRHTAAAAGRFWRLLFYVVVTLFLHPVILPPSSPHGLCREYFLLIFVVALFHYRVSVVVVLHGHGVQDNYDIVFSVPVFVFDRVTGCWIGIFWYACCRELQREYFPFVFTVVVYSVVTGCAEKMFCFYFGITGCVTGLSWHGCEGIIFLVSRV